ncbi:mannosyltransferase putative-domain-containing protein [Phaeosphaeriaceae sp. PMI808]|nr:mannosyltransferase putative-domain-containing protein [Phaeosphaeriaceae sp. PMI808]
MPKATMLIHTPSCTSTIVRLGALILFLITCSSYFLPRRLDHPTPFPPVIDVSKVKNLTEASSTFNASAIDFWQDLAFALIAAEPLCKPLQVFEESIQHPEDGYEPLKTDKQLPQRLVGFTEQDETALLRAHYKMRRAAQRLAPKIAFATGTTGIVTTANSDYMPILLVSLRMLRRTGCNLPMEVFIDDWSHYSHTTCEIVLPSLNACCVVLSNIYAQNTTLKKPDHYQYKILSILFSSFQHDSASSRLSTESGQILLNKDTHRESLLLMVYYNYYGPTHYYPLLCQGSHGAGDKETFIQAALATGLPWYQVRTAPDALGRWWNGTFRGTGIAQADPGLDYEYLPPHASHIHPENKWKGKDVSHPNAKIEAALNRTRKAPRSPRPVFLHQNVLKLDPGRVLLDKGEVVYEPDGTLHRMWGSKEHMEKILGYDVERRLWDVVAEEACRVDRASEKCRRVGAYVREVFGWMDSIDRPW